MPTTKSSEFISGLVAFVREKQGMSCKDLANLLEKDYNYIWKVENGCKNISSEYLDKIIEKLNLPQETFWAFVPEYLQHLQDLKNQQPLTNH